MPRWQYLFVATDISEPSQLKTQAVAFDVLGDEGWELVAMTPLAPGLVASCGSKAKCRRRAHDPRRSCLANRSLPALVARGGTLLAPAHLHSARPYAGATAGGGATMNERTNVHCPRCKQALVRKAGDGTERILWCPACNVTYRQEGGQLTQQSDRP